MVVKPLDYRWVEPKKPSAPHSPGQVMPDVRLAQAAQHTSDLRQFVRQVCCIQISMVEGFFSTIKMKLP
ncbi:hypothetical protein [Cyanobium sp. ATX-6F1]|uniref:hypothetical protein n=1 Tax=Cyanobium sp. ATX-6F1 TaxID=3137388 RepID=UPI0039BDF375